MQRRGISLVALVITIIVLIILTAGVIMLAGGENGIIGRAQRAVEANNMATATEKVLLEVSNIKMEVAGTGQTVSEYLYDTINGETRREELEGKGISVPVTLPVGNEIVFTVGDYSVITDLNGNIQSTEKNIPLTITELSITTDGTIVPEDGTVNNGTQLQINFIPKVTGGTVDTITPALPYTTNGAYKNITFTIAGTYKGIAYEETRKISLISKYIPLGTPVGYDAINVGDYINYDAGTWTQDQITALQTARLYSGATLPTSSTPYNFGGFKVGDSRNECITPYSTYSNTISSGWRVISKNGDNTITIAHAGTPEGYYPLHESNCGYKSEYILSEGERQGTYASGATARNWDMYENEYAIEKSAHLWTGAEAEELPELRTTGAYYWLSSAASNVTVYSVRNDGEIATSYTNCYGVRPVVSLKSNIQVAGYTGTKDANNPWEIVGLGE